MKPTLYFHSCRNERHFVNSDILKMNFLSPFQNRDCANNEEIKIQRSQNTASES
jgi:transcriptional regulator of met regulon